MFKVQFESLRQIMANTVAFIDVIVFDVYRDTVNVSGNRPSGEGQGRARWGASGGASGGQAF